MKFFGYIICGIGWLLIYSACTAKHGGGDSFMVGLPMAVIGGWMVSKGQKRQADQERNSSPPSASQQSGRSDPRLHPDGNGRQVRWECWEPGLFAVDWTHSKSCPHCRNVTTQKWSRDADGSVSVHCKGCYARW
jgi:hypothetical protein